jgi:hypothetical protein
MAHLDQGPIAAPVAGVAEPPERGHSGSACCLQGVFSAAEADLLIARIRALATSSP